MLRRGGTRGVRVFGCDENAFLIGLNPTEGGVAVRTTKQLSITLPNNMAEALRQRVDSGEYASESEVIRDGLRALFARDAAVEQWLRTEVVEAYDELRANPDQAITSAELRKQLKEAREQKMAAAQ